MWMAFVTAHMNLTSVKGMKKKSKNLTVYISSSLDIKKK